MSAITFDRKTLQAGDGVPLGLFVKIPAREVCELVALAGYDFVIIDTEHAPLGVREVFEMIRTYDQLGVAPVVRAVRSTDGEAQRLLDMGARGIMFPHVADGDEARRLTDPLLFPPKGSRGSGFASPAGLWGGLAGGRSEYLRFGDEEVIRIAMLEDEGAIADVRRIASAPGVDALFIGASDLALSMGESPGSDRVRALVDRAIDEATDADIPVGLITTSPDEARRRIDQRCAYLVVGNDTGLFRSALEERHRSVGVMRGGGNGAG